jgi:hypothetical protein
MLKVGDVVFFNWKEGFYSKCITFFNTLKYKCSLTTHAGIVSAIEGDYVLIHEAVYQDGEDFKANPYLSSWIVQNCIVGRSKAKITGSIKDTCKKYESINYDWLSIFLMPFRLTFNSTKNMFCSEAVARVLYDCTDKQFNVKNWEKLTPMDLLYCGQLDIVNSISIKQGGSK